MTRRSTSLDTFLDIGGSKIRIDGLSLLDEQAGVGPVVFGQSGGVATITVVGADVFVAGLTGMTAQSVGRYLTISGADSSVNNGTFQIISYVGFNQVLIKNSVAVTDANNGSIFWEERTPFTLRDELNYMRSDRALIKGDTYYSNLPQYIRPTDPFNGVATNLTNISNKTTDAKSIIASKKQANVSVGVGNTFKLITNTGNVKYAVSTDITGVPIFDGYDSNNYDSTFAEIVDASTGFTLAVLGGANTGNHIVGRTRAGGSGVDGNSVEIEFRSISPGAALSTSVAYTWEAGQSSSINVYYPYRHRLDLMDENALRGMVSGGIGTTAGGGGGITSAQHAALRQLIHLADGGGPYEQFVSGAYREISGGIFPTNVTWYDDSSKTKKIVEKIIYRNQNKTPATIQWKVYDTDGSTVLATATDNIVYNGVFELNRTRTIS